MSDPLRRERHDLHEPFLAQLATHRPEDARGAGLALIREEHRRILVEPDVRAVLTPRLLRGAHDHGLHHLALLDLTGGDGVLDRDHHDVAQTPVATFRAAQHANHERAARARVVRDLEYRFLLDHVPPPPLARALDHFDHAPPLPLRERPRLYDPHRVPLLPTLVVMGPDLLGPDHLLALEPFPEPADQRHGTGH